jgi:hypothetical protein
MLVLRPSEFTAACYADRFCTASVYYALKKGFRVCSARRDPSKRICFVFLKLIII